MYRNDLDTYSKIIVSPRQLDCFIFTRSDTGSSYDDVNIRR